MAIWYYIDCGWCHGLTTRGCWSAFRKPSFKRQLVCEFYTTIFFLLFLLLFIHIHLDVYIYDISWYIYVYSINVVLTFYFYFFICLLICKLYYTCKFYIPVNLIITALTSISSPPCIPIKNYKFWFKCIWKWFQKSPVRNKKRNCFTNLGWDAADWFHR